MIVGILFLVLLGAALIYYGFGWLLLGAILLGFGLKIKNG